MKIIFVNGCFDVLHPGHIKLFQYAKSLGDYLIVAIDSDLKITGDKGLNRPIFPLEDRKFILESIKYIDQFKSDKLCLVAGSIWKEDQIILVDYINRSKENRLPPYISNAIKLVE